MEQKSHTPVSSKTTLVVLQFLLPIVMAIIAGYGAVRYSTGQTEQRLLEVERKVQANDDRIDKMGEKTVSRDELRQFIDATRSDLADIKTDIRALRR